MPRRKTGYRNLTLQLPDVLYARLAEDAGRSERAMSRILAGMLADAYGVPLSELPPPSRTGRKPKGGPAA